MTPALTLCVVWFAASTVAAGQPAEPRHVGRDRDLADVTLVRSSDEMAVVRVGTGPLETVRRGDFLGRHRAEITEIVAGRLTVIETFTGKDGRPNRAQVIWSDGQRGGRRYLQRVEHGAPAATKPAIKPPGR